MSLLKFLTPVQECSPYAAHLYDAEDANTPMRILPGLCGNYCNDYWSQCRYTLSLLLEDQGSLGHYANLTATLEEDHRLFCEFLELKDKQYCYPNVLTNAGMSTQTEARLQSDTRGMWKLNEDLSEQESCQNMAT